MQERETKCWVSGRQGSALAVSRFFSAKAAGVDLTRLAIEVTVCHVGSQVADGGGGNHADDEAEHDVWKADDGHRRGPASAIKKSVGAGGPVPRRRPTALSFSLRSLAGLIGR